MKLVQMIQRQGGADHQGCGKSFDMAGLKSLVHALLGHFFFEHEGHRAVREGRYKITALRGEPWCLYDMEKDRTETEDLSSKYPNLVKELARKWDAWGAQNNVTPLPSSYRVDYLREQ